MRYPILFSICIFIFLSGCKKDKYATRPSLKFKSVNTNVLQQDQSLRFTLSFTDAEGDLTDSLFVSKVEPNCAGSNFSEEYGLPSFPSSKNQSGDLLVTFAYNDVVPQCADRNDTAVFKFVLRDKAKNVSDTVSSPAIIIVNP